MFHDARSAVQKARADKRCPTCGHRPQDAVDELVRREMGSASYHLTVCANCGGMGCTACNLTGRISQVRSSS